MKQTTETRVRKLEQKAKPKGKGYLAVYMDPDTPGVYWEHSPFSKDKGQQYSKTGLEEYDPVLVVNYVKDWRKNEH
jgi:hypothetical protein